MKSTRRPTEFEQNNRDVTSIPGYVIKKNRKRGVEHGTSERQKMYFQAKQMLKKAGQEKHGGHPTILSRWYACDEHRESLSDIAWREHHIILYDRIALEKHIFKATRAERIRLRIIGFLQKSLSAIGWKEHHIMLHDRIAVESTSTSLQELKEFKIRSIGFSR